MDTWSVFQNDGSISISVIAYNEFILYLILGNHYWFDNRLEINCEQFLPAFLLYNKGQLTGFGWDIARKLNISTQTEFPPKEAIFVSESYYISDHFH